jgi:arylsulfatase A-like enzyme
MERISALFIGCCLLPGCTQGRHDNKQAKKPNIIFILTDDQRWDAVGYSGNPIIHTPEMNRLAGEGTCFRNAFVTTPISAASRASILTGMYERTHGYTFEQGPLKEPYMKLSYPVIMKNNGYHTGFFGKLGVTYKDAVKLFDKADIYDRNGKYPDRRGYFYKTIGNDTVHLTQYTGHQAREFIQNAPADKPFCLSLSFSAPHAHDNAPEQYIWQEKSDRLYKDVIIPPPPLSEEKYFMALPEEVRNGYNRLRWTWRFDTPEKYQHSVKGYYRMISEIDDEIGEIRNLLEEKGIAGNTVIIFTSDNGYYLGERQLAGKWLMHDNSIRVPLIIYDPRINKHREVEDMVLNIDITSTILDIAGAEIPEKYQGVSLFPYLKNKKPAKNREKLLFEHLWEIPEIPSSEGIRTEKWKYFRYRFIDAPEELYDLESDPLETKNLATDPEYIKIITELRSECDRQISLFTLAGEN